MVLVLGQDSLQMLLALDQYPVQEFPAQGADKALAGRVRPRRLGGGAQDTGTRGLEDGVEGAGEVRSAIADQEPEVVEALVESEGQVAGTARSSTCCYPDGATGSL